MKSPSDRWDDRGSPSHRIHLQDTALTARQARRLSRRFADVGVTVPATRLTQIDAGATVSSEEWTDINFALTVTELHNEERLARIQRRRRTATRCLIFVGLTLVALNFLGCLAYGLVSMVEHSF